VGAEGGARADPASLTDRLLQGLGCEGIAACDEFLTPVELKDLIECAHTRRERGDFLEARIGSGRELRHRPDIRGDSICWLAEPLLAPERGILERLERIRIALNRSAYLGLSELEAHYAWYPPGAGYAPHVDQLRGGRHRRVSLIVYLNEDWRCPDDGGLLRCVADDGGDRLIAPVGGRLVAFMTEGREHEVRSTRRARLSITAWFLGCQGSMLR